MRGIRSAVGSSVVALVVLTGCAGSDEPGTDDRAEVAPFAEEYSVLGALAEVPSIDEDGLLVQTADVQSASEAAGLDVPVEGTREAVGPWSLALSGTPREGRDAARVFVPFPESFNLQAASPEEFADVLGFSVLDARAFVEASARPTSFTAVVGGEELQASDDLVALEDGIVTDREGEDLEQDLAAASPVSRIGLPVRVAGEPGHLAFGTSTPLLRSWLDGADTLADDESLAGVAAALDEQDVLSAVLTRVEGEQDPVAEVEDQVPAEPFDAVGIGWSASEGDPAAHVAYHFGSDEAATDAVEVLESSYADGTSQRSRQPYSDLFTLEGVSAEGPVVTVDVTPKAGRVAVLYQMLQQREPLFVSR